MLLIVKSILQQRLSTHFDGTDKMIFHPVSGGSINETYRLHFGNTFLFCKINSATKFPHLFAKEKAGLQRLAKENRIKTPTVIDCFEEGGYQLLLLEWINQGEKTTVFWKRFGEQLAALHLVSNERHGLNEDNYMGSVQQSNRQYLHWVDFFSEQRIGPMVRRCEEKGLLQSTHLRQMEAVEKKLKTFFEEEPPSLLHGDLWNGNFLCNEVSEPVLIDPAVYFGHRSMDLAMTTLFGGFREPFYDAYRYHYPLPVDYGEQWAICNLYPLLIHLYLFGAGYLPQIEQTLKRFT